MSVSAIVKFSILVVILEKSTLDPMFVLLKYTEPLVVVENSAIFNLNFKF